MQLSALFLGAFAVTISSAAAQAAAPAARTPTLAAIGIGVTNLTASTQFYTSVLGLSNTGQRYSTPQFDEVVLKLPGVASGSALVLMQYKQPKNVANLPIKLVFYVDNVKAQIEKIRKAGMKITLEPGTGVLGNRTIPTGFGLDPDGYALEINPVTALGTA
jgi:catechol 2,3-dioxygenase-like lactoylglutathione lyase family enzyme